MLRFSYIKNVFGMNFAIISDWSVIRRKRKAPVAWTTTKKYLLFTNLQPCFSRASAPPRSSPPKIQTQNCRHSSISNFRSLNPHFFPHRFLLRGELSNSSRMTTLAPLFEFNWKRVRCPWYLLHPLLSPRHCPTGYVQDGDLGGL